jgi:hypothetical protein
MARCLARARHCGSRHSGYWRKGRGCASLFIEHAPLVPRGRHMRHLAVNLARRELKLCGPCCSSGVRLHLLRHRRRKNASCTRPRAQRIGT